MAPLTETTLYLTNLSETTTEADIRALFSPYGTVRTVRLSRGTPDLGSRGFGYLDIDSNAVQSAISGLDGHIFKGTIIGVSSIADVTQESQASDGHLAGRAEPIDDGIPSNLMRYEYEVESIERVVMPDDGQGGEWYRYILASGRTRLAGLHRGTRDEVMAYAESCANDFNLRNAIGKTPRVSIPARKK